MGELVCRTTTPAKATKRAPAKKTAAKKVAKQAAAHKVAGKKSPARKATAKRAAKKVPAKKAAAKKAPPKKVPSHKADAHRPQKNTKKSAGKKGTAKKSADPLRNATSQEPTMGLPELPAPPNDPLVVLGLKEPLHRAALRRAWRGFAARHHPDRGGDAVTFARGQSAYQALQRSLGCEG